jgi:hypothetical protein
MNVIILIFHCFLVNLLSLSLKKNLPSNWFSPMNTNFGMDTSSCLEEDSSRISNESMHFLKVQHIPVVDQKITRIPKHKRGIYKEKCRINRLICSNLLPLSQREREIRKSIKRMNSLKETPWIEKNEAYYAFHYMRRTPVLSKFRAS